MFWGTLQKNSSKERFMLNLALNFSLATATLFLAVLFIPGLQFEHILTIVPTCFILGLMNFLIRPLLVFMGMDVTPARIGTFAFVMNWVLLNVGIGLVDEFDEYSWMGALFGAVLMGLLQAILWAWDFKGRKPVT
jgi:putative membrane protein